MQQKRAAAAGRSHTVHPLERLTDQDIDAIFRVITYFFNGAIHAVDHDLLIGGRIPRRLHDCIGCLRMQLHDATFELFAREKVSVILTDYDGIDAKLTEAVLKNGRFRGTEVKEGDSWTNSRRRGHVRYGPDCAHYFLPF